MKQSAFTLLEMLLALAVAAILMLLVIPGIKGMAQQNKQDALCKEMLSLIYFAKNQAETRRQVVTICKSDDQKTCSGDWSDGQLVFVDVENNGTIRDSEQVLLAKQLNTKQGDLYVQFYPSYRDSIKFSPISLDGSDNGTVWYCRKDATMPSWAIRISKVGDASVVYPNKHGQINDSHGHGNSLTCWKSLPATLPATGS
tara:strand:- start:232 stop:828 length:597 start_codon:yes stop_codon:yes gene_type:complete